MLIKLVILLTTLSFLSVMFLWAIVKSGSNKSDNRPVPGNQVTGIDNNIDIAETSLKKCRHKPGNKHTEDYREYTTIRY